MGRLTDTQIEDLCYGRDDLLAIAEQICFESGLNKVDGEDLCQLLADECIRYLKAYNW